MLNMFLLGPLSTRSHRTSKSCPLDLLGNIYIYTHMYVCIWLYMEYDIAKLWAVAWRYSMLQLKAIPRKNVPNEAWGTVPNCHWKDIGCYKSMQMICTNQTKFINHINKHIQIGWFTIRVGPPVLGSTAVDGKKHIQTLQQTLSWTLLTPNLNVSARVTKSGLIILSIGAITHFSSQYHWTLGLFRACIW